MMKKTHMSVGVTVSSLVAAAIGIKVNPMFIISSAIGSIFPDVDHPNGAINQKILLVHSWLFKCVTYLCFAALIIIYGSKHLDPKIIYCSVPVFVAIAMSRHRGITHSLVGLVGAVAIMSFIKSKYGLNIIIPFSFGVSSHILLDMFNPEGVELLWPYKRHFRFPINISTNGFGEKILFYGFTLGVIYLFMISYGQLGEFFRSSIRNISSIIHVKHILHMYTHL